jgi:glycosyltransferase involved in cell wall biosynthesis
MFFSVIIPVYNNSEYLQKNLKYLENQTFKDFEVIIVSENNFENEIKNYNLNSKFLYDRNIYLPGEKRNLASKISKGNYLAFIDDDAYPSSDWLAVAYKSIIQHKNNKICLGGPGILCDDETFFGKCADLFYTSDLFYSDSERYKQNLKLNYTEVDDWPSVNFIISKSFFIEIEGFDIFYWPGEDSKICKKIYKNAGVIIYNSNLVIYHYKRSNIIKHIKQIFRYGLHRGIFFKKLDSNSFKIKYANLMKVKF